MIVVIAQAIVGKIIKKNKITPIRKVHVDKENLNKFSCLINNIHKIIFT